MNRKDYPEVLKPEHVAEILGISVPTAYAYMKRNDFPSFKYMGTIRTMRDSLFAWMMEKVEKGA